MTVQTPNGSLNWKSILSVPLPTQTFSATNTLLAHECPMGLAMYLWAILSQESTYMGEMKSRTSYSPGKASSHLEQQAARSGQMTTSSSASIPFAKAQESQARRCGSCCGKRKIFLAHFHCNCRNTKPESPHQYFSFLLQKTPGQYPYLQENVSI